MQARRRVFVASVVVLLCVGVRFAAAQSPSVLYTWDDTGNASPNIEGWLKTFGVNTVTLDNTTTPGALTIIETGADGTGVAISDGFNRTRESNINGTGGTDLTGLDFLEFDLGHSGGGPVAVQFFVQASTGPTFVSLGADVMVQPGINTYKVPISGLTADQAVYVRTMGFNIRDHLAEGNLTWTLEEVRSSGTPLTTRVLVSHDTGTAEGGLQGAIGNFDLAAIQGSDGGVNQTGLSHNPSGSGSLQWTDLGGSQGAAISWGNGTAWNGNTFNNRTLDISNYATMTVRISATDPLDGGGEIGLNAFILANNFAFQAMEGGAGRNLPIDGQFYDLVFSLAGLSHLNAVDQVGINLFAHGQNLIMNVDSIVFNADVSAIPEPRALLAAIPVIYFVLRRPSRRTC
jgi:hypothetical protein